MKKLLAVVLVLLLCVACSAEGGELLSLVKSRGLDAEAADWGGGALRCDLTLSGDGGVAMTWTDAKHLYTLSGDRASLCGLYPDALALGGWEACNYTVNGVTQISYGADSARRCDTLEAYAEAVRTELGLTAFANALLGVTRDYVLNKRSRKFHYPDCSGIRDMSPRNREDFNGTREEIIARGYTPCGICKP